MCWRAHTLNKEPSDMRATLMYGAGDVRVQARPAGPLGLDGEGEHGLGEVLQYGAPRAYVTGEDDHLGPAGGGRAFDELRHRFRCRRRMGILARAPFRAVLSFDAFEP